MNNREKPWQIAADLETAAKAVREAQITVGSVHRSVWPEYDAIEAIGNFEADDSIAKALQALSDKYQAIADAEEAA